MAFAAPNVNRAGCKQGCGDVGHYYGDYRCPEAGARKQYVSATSRRLLDSSRWVQVFFLFQRKEKHSRWLHCSLPGSITSFFANPKKEVTRKKDWCRWPDSNRHGVT